MSDFSVYTAEQVADWMSQGVVATAPSDLYVTVRDGAGTELSSEFQNARVQTTAGTDWTITNTAFENAALIDFGEALSDVTDIQTIAIHDAETGGNELAAYQLTDAPFDISEGSELVYEAGQVDFDIIDRTE